MIYWVGDNKTFNNSMSYWSSAISLLTEINEKNDNMQEKFKSDTSGELKKYQGFLDNSFKFTANLKAITPENYAYYLFTQTIKRFVTLRTGDVKGKVFTNQNAKSLYVYTARQAQTLDIDKQRLYQLAKSNHLLLTTLEDQYLQKTLPNEFDEQFFKTAISKYFAKFSDLKEPLSSGQANLAFDIIVGVIPHVKELIAINKPTQYIESVHKLVNSELDKIQKTFKENEKITIATNLVKNYCDVYLTINQPHNKKAHEGLVAKKVMILRSTGSNYRVIGDFYAKELQHMFAELEQRYFDIEITDFWLKNEGKLKTKHYKEIAYLYSCVNDIYRAFGNADKSQQPFEIIEIAKINLVANDIIKNLEIVTVHDKKLIDFIEKKYLTTLKDLGSNKELSFSKYIELIRVLRHSTSTIALLSDLSYYADKDHNNLTVKSLLGECEKFPNSTIRDFFSYIANNKEQYEISPHITALCETTLKAGLQAKNLQSYVLTYLKSDVNKSSFIANYLLLEYYYFLSNGEEANNYLENINTIIANANVDDKLNLALNKERDSYSEHYETFHKMYNTRYKDKPKNVSFKEYADKRFIRELKSFPNNYMDGIIKKINALNHQNINVYGTLSNLHKDVSTLKNVAKAHYKNLEFIGEPNRSEQENENLIDYHNLAFLFKKIDVKLEFLKRYVAENSEQKETLMNALQQKLKALSFPDKETNSVQLNKILMAIEAFLNDKLLGEGLPVVEPASFKSKSKKGRKKVSFIDTLGSQLRERIKIDSTYLRHSKDLMDIESDNGVTTNHSDYPSKHSLKRMCNGDEMNIIKMQKPNNDDNLREESFAREAKRNFSKRSIEAENQEVNTDNMIVPSTNNQGCSLNNPFIISSDEERRSDNDIIVIDTDSDEEDSSGLGRSYRIN